jgi:hypothetical protein
MTGENPWRPDCQALDEGLSAHQPRWSMFGGILNDIYTKISALPLETSWEIRRSPDAPLIGHVTAGDFLAKFTSISWKLTDSAYDNGGVGEVVSQYTVSNGVQVWSSAAEQINAASFDVYMAWPDNIGSVYLALHETAHVTELGLSTGRTCYSMFIDHGGDPKSYANSPYWAFNEGVANQIAKEIATTLGWQTLGQPGGGYPDDVMTRTVEHV